MKISKLRALAIKYGWTLIIILFVCISILPMVLRALHGDPLVSGDQSYLQLRYADSVLHENFGYDVLRNEPFLLTPYTIILALFQFMHVAWLLPLFLGAIFLYVLLRVIRQQAQAPFISFVTLAIVTISPMFSVLTSSYDPVLLGIIFLAAAFLYTDTHITFATLLLTLGVVTTPGIGVVIAAYFIIRTLGKKNIHGFIGVLMSLFVSLIWYMMWMQSLPNIPSFAGWENVFFELGVAGGISIFFLIVAVFGMAIPGIHERKWLITLTLSSLVLATTLPLIPVITVLLSYFTAYAVRALVIQNWSQNILRQLTVVLIVCAALFVFTINITQAVHRPPSTDFVQVMEKIGFDRHGGNVLTDPIYAPMVEYFSKRRATLVDPTHEELQQAFYTRHASEVYDFLDKTNTRYILIDAAMQERLFTYSDEGLLFVLPNSKKFINIEQSDNLRVWYYVQPQGG